MLISKALLLTHLYLFCFPFNTPLTNLDENSSRKHNQKDIKNYDINATNSVMRSLVAPFKPVILEKLVSLDLEKQ